MDPLKCPRCASTQLYAGDKGFSLGKAAAGGILLGSVGLLGGFIGSKKIMITCLKCGYKWQAGKHQAASSDKYQAGQGQSGFNRVQNDAVLLKKEPGTEAKLRILKKHLAEGKITQEQFDKIKAELRGK